MEFNKTNTSAFDSTVRSLCDEIDYLKLEVDHWQNKYEELLAETHIAQKERLLDAQKGVANALKLCLAVTDDEHGNLVISKENRKKLANNLNQNKE